MKTSKVERLVEPCNLISVKTIQFGFEEPIFTIDDFTMKDIVSDNNTKEELKTKGWTRYIGIFFAILASIVFSLGTVVVKTLQSYSAFNISAWRFQGVLLPSIIVLIYHWARGNSNIIKNIWPLHKPGVKRNIGYLVLRGLLGGGAMVSQVISLQYMNIADSTVIVFSSPVFVTFLAHYILGETLGIVPVVSSILTLAGVVVITRPPILTGGGEISIENLFGIGMALTSMLFGCCVIIVLRFLRDVSTTLITTGFGGVGTILCITLALSTGVFQSPQSREDWIFALILGCLTFSGQIFFTLALQYEEAGPVAMIRSGDVIFSFLWQFIFLGTQPDIYSVIGAVIVIAGVLIIGIRKLVERMPEEDNTRKRFWFLLM